MNHHDFYNGYEPEPEISIYTDPEGDSIRMWVGYFDALMELVKPVDGRWEGIALEYHTQERWEQEPWVIPDVQRELSVLAQIDVSASNSDDALREDLSEIRLAMIRLLERAVESKSKVLIQLR